MLQTAIGKDSTEGQGTDFSVLGNMVVGKEKLPF